MTKTSSSFPGGCPRDWFHQHLERGARRPNEEGRGANKQKYDEHSDNPSEIPLPTPTTIQSNSFQASLPALEGPGVSYSNRSAWPRSSKTWCRFEFCLCRLPPLGHPMGQDGFGRGLALWRVHGVLVPLREKGSHLAVVGCPLLFWSEFDLIGVVLVRQVDPLTIYYTVPDILGTACGRRNWVAYSRERRYSAVCRRGRGSRRIQHPGSH